MTQAAKTLAELEQNACLYWPKDLSAAAAASSLLIPLLATQEHFLSILKSADKHPLAWRDALHLSGSLSPNLFLKHLMVLSDIGGERLQRFAKDFDVLFPTGKLRFVWRQREHEHLFSQTKRVWTNKKLFVEKSVLSQPLDALTDDMLDVCMLILWAGLSVETEGIPQEMFEKCLIGDLIGQPDALENFVKQRYIHVSKMSGGSLANDLGHLCEQYVVDKLSVHLPAHIVLGGHTIDDISHNDRNLTTFDVVAHNQQTQKSVGIEISFQVTTNSVIERKAGLAKSRQQVLHNKGHSVAYIIDGSGNFQRRNAIQTILSFADCVVNFSDQDLTQLAQFIVERTHA